MCVGSTKKLNTKINNGPRSKFLMNSILRSTSNINKSTSFVIVQIQGKKIKDGKRLKRSIFFQFFESKLRMEQKAAHACHHRLKSTSYPNGLMQSDINLGHHFMSTRAKTMF
ncbi:hypothetical protein CDAR_5991 [Caerostris darwini]|uniref:Uncharacterized protein n=1 Tax=Caerostris darwini TaxID=1538125 RepID=A0AAV4RE65_9ARAC|nr:hypothetical protein CDAR_5991 [Caerostris darwini]